ncbi:hypothetical protein ES288_D12G126800v1 [Gossypium darwinii]|uniref:Digalactosyldiacylglycerol synthase n=1 Tax=Gossypium darwinii TaxID=34276 RepID=A0A5D2A7M7_GOSDA|nr:hypothetical protein ES288_D12G126800v1 [Gossypium darwinii]
MDRRQRIAIFTTASLPWMTGTAINPLFRAAYLAKGGDRKITLVIPWSSLKDQKLVYPNNAMFGSPWEQESYIGQWLERRIAFIPDFGICFYPGKFAVDKRSIIPVGDILEIISNEEADIAVLGEPKHLTWFHHGKRWKTKFRLYVKREKNGRLLAFLPKYLNSWVVSIYCHKVIRLSAATQDYPRSIICNLHGVNPKFLEVGKKIFEQLQSRNRAFTKGGYYIGKMELAGLEIDLYGNTEDSDRVKEAGNKLKLVVRVHPGRDHADPLFHDTTDVVRTTTAEALAMGKIVICANHPSNDFFKRFSNCRTYDDGNGFIEATQLNQVVAKELDKNQSMKFASISLNLQKNMEATPAYLHYVALGFETTRRAFGAIPESLYPDEEQCKELGLFTLTGRVGSKKDN